MQRDDLLLGRKVRNIFGDRREAAVHARVHLRKGVGQRLECDLFLGHDDIVRALSCTASARSLDG
jgi:hypothetical protein